MREAREERCMDRRGRQLMVLHLVSQLPRQTHCLPACQWRLGPDLTWLNVGHCLAHHHWVTQLLQRLHFILNHLLDEWVKVDGEGEEDLEVSYC